MTGTKLAFFNSSPAAAKLAADSASFLFNSFNVFCLRSLYFLPASTDLIPSSPGFHWIWPKLAPVSNSDIDFILLISDIILSKFGGLSPKSFNPLIIVSLAAFRL